MGKEFTPNKKNPELTEWLNARQGSLKINKTTVTPNGQVIDWVPIESQSKEKIATPPVDESNVVTEADSRNFAIIYDIGEQGPGGHVPVLRPDISKLPEGIGLKDFSSKRGGLKFRKKSAGGKAAPPSPAGYFHAASWQSIQAYGCDALLNVWDPKIDTTSGIDHSISQTWVLNQQNASTQSVEAGWTVDRGLNGDLNPHLFIFYTTNNYAFEADYVGGYNQQYKGWVQVHKSYFPGMLLSPVSVINGAQVELGIKYQLYENNWWFAIKFHATDPWAYIGYYPASLYNGGLANAADSIGFGGEIYSGLANPCNTTDQMGSGIQADGGYAFAAYQRNLHNQSNANGTMANFNGTPETDAAAANCQANNYSIDCFMNSASAWESFQYYGGPAPGLRFRVYPNEEIWQWVDYGTMVDDGIHPWNPDFRYLLTGIVMADLAKFSSPSLTKDFLKVAAKQIEVAARGIVNEINGFAEKLE